MDLTTLLTWGAGFGVLFLAVFIVFGFFVLRFIWRCFREVEKGRREFDERWQARRMPRHSQPSSSVRQHSERVRSDVEAFDRDFERRFNRSRAP